ncbi:hypothetical protein PIECOFPK_02037 [Mycovorax composti]|uniref:Saccharopine dehydrogenase n=1 Tax=Mycovorax composti TaxID=2962693 RepID=A0ABZ2ELX3_9BACT
MSSASKNILLFGAGKSATVLIRYLLQKAQQYNWTLTVAEADVQLALAKTQSHPRSAVLKLDVTQNDARMGAIQNADVVISLLPPHLHYLVAKDCIAHKKHLLTASYVDEKIRLHEKDIQQSGILFLCEMGLDPGIDHMSAMRLIDEIKSQGGNIKSFKSHCGGLVAPESDDNPWHYKISWNPANVVNAGKAGAIYRDGHQTVRLSYTDVFNSCKRVATPAIGEWAYYANRDSLPYMQLYNLQETATFIRTTLRHPDFCKGWQHLVDAGLTDNEHSMEKFRNAPVNTWLRHVLQHRYRVQSFEEYLKEIVLHPDRPLIRQQFEYLGLTGETLIPEHIYSAADILQHFLESRLKLRESDKDMVIMLHEIVYEQNGTLHKINSSLMVKGDDHQQTAMAKTVGLPLGIAAELILNNELSLKGLHIPIIKDIYVPVLRKLEENNLKFIDI